MVLIKKSFSFIGSTEEFRKTIQAYTDLSGAVIKDQQENNILIKTGDLFSLNPNTIFSKMHISLSENASQERCSEGEIIVTAPYPFWLNKKITQILTIRLETLLAFIEQKFSIEHLSSKKEYSLNFLKYPLNLFGKSDFVDIAYKYFSCFISLLLCIMAGFISSFIIGLILIQKNIYQATINNHLGNTSISNNILQNISSTKSILCSASFMGFPGSMSLGIFIFFLFIICELSKIISCNASLFFFISFFFLMFFFISGLGLLGGILSLAVLFPIGYFLYSLPWALRYKKIYFNFNLDNIK